MDATRFNRLSPRLASALSAFASLYTVLPAGEWLSVTKASVAAGGTSGMGQPWAVDTIRDLVRFGCVETRRQGNRQWVRPVDASALLAWAKEPAHLEREGQTLENWTALGRTWVLDLSAR